MKLDGIQYIRDWLLEVRERTPDGKEYRNLDRIWDKGLLQEMISFDLEGNYDRVMGFMGCIVGLNETHNQYEKEIKQQSIEMNTIDFLSNNPKLFRTSDNRVNVKVIDDLEIDWNKI